MLESKEGSVGRFLGGVTGLAILAIGFAMPPAHAADLSWTGTFEILLDDDGMSTYSAAMVDDVFTGSFVYEDVCNPGINCIVEPQAPPPAQTNYVFTNPGNTGVIDGIGITTVGVESSVEITNDEVVDGDAQALAAALGLAVNVGDTFDAWTLGSETAGEVLEFEIAFLYATTNPFSDTSYTATPPPNPDLIIFEIDENGETYEAIGLVTSVPEPAPSMLAIAALTVLLPLAGLRRA